jgi:hypothetical protein
MGRIHQGVSVGAWLVSALLPACSNEEDSYERPAGRGTAACQAWQKSMCDLVVKCGGLSERECVDNFYGMSCLSDSVAQSCATSLASASCAGIPAGCDVPDVVDPAPAVAACNALIAATCQRGVDCGGTTMAACTSEAAASLDCSTAMAYTLDYEKCMSQIGALACTATALPDSCTSVILQNPGS